MLISAYSKQQLTASRPCTNVLNVDWNTTHVTKYMTNDYWNTFTDFRVAWKL